MITVLVWSERLLALAIFLQTLELLKLKPIWIDSGIWRWSVVRQDYQKLPPFILRGLDFFLSETHFELLLKTRITISVLVWFIHPALFIGILFLSTWLIAIRWRGIFNGGSDSMTALIAISLTLAQASQNHPLILKACFAYIAVQITASYALAGLAKIKNPEWREGLALPVFFKTPRYNSPPPFVQRLMTKPSTAKQVSWGIMMFECSFPLAWINPKFCLAYIFLAIIFHVLNFYVFGLNRFFFAWLAGYPALYFWSVRN